MTRRVALPPEIVLLVVEKLDLPTVCLFLKALPDFVPLLSTVHFSIRDASGNCILHILAAEGEHELLWQVLRCKTALPDAKNKDMDTPLSLAVSRGHLLVVEALLNGLDVDTNFTNDLGRTLLHLAALNGHVSVIEMLIHWTGVDINGQDDRGQTAVSLAAELATPVTFGLPPWPSKYCEDTTGTKACRDHALDDRRSTPLCYAAYNGNPFTIQLLIARDDVDIYLGTYDSRFPLSLAVESGNCTAVKLLLNRMRQQNPTVTGEVDHQFSVELNRRDIWGRTPLFTATEQGHEDMVGLLVSLPEVDVNASTIRYGQGTSLASAAKNGRENIVQLLLTRPDIDIGALDIHRRTPRDLATLEGHKSIALKLQRFHLDPDSEV
ncbi:ankyrin repeat-containing domain protein [Aspergillus sergii]|uniref:Ankyrin repeat-containing domain protein n=1 Tax=Aspergillus sergii TaxID=1034303 RepID=A0A5N6WV84_9EURO|nr:ankyrin repeat-containing domain protein [Aspergillus sergii]